MTTEVTMYGRLSFEKISSPEPNAQGVMAYSTALLLPPDTDLKPLKNALKAAMIDKHGTNEQEWVKLGKFRGPKDIIKLCSDDQKHFSDPMWAGWHIISTTTYKTPPGICDANVVKVVDMSQVYSGRWSYVAMNAYWFNKRPPQQPQHGLTLGLQGIQLMKNDTRLGGGPAPVETYFQKQVIPAGEDAFATGGTAPAAATGETASNPWD